MRLIYIRGNKSSLHSKMLCSNFLKISKESNRLKKLLDDSRDDFERIRKIFPFSTFSISDNLLHIYLYVDIKYVIKHPYIVKLKANCFELKSKLDTKYIKIKCFSYYDYYLSFIRPNYSNNSIELADYSELKNYKRLEDRVNKQIINYIIENKCQINFKKSYIPSSLKALLACI